MQPQGHVTTPVTKTELITDTQPELICRHKDRTHCRHKDRTNLSSQRRNLSHSQRRVLRYQCHTDYSIQLGNHRVITRHGTRIKHKEFTDYMNSKHNSFPSSFTKPFNIQRYSQASQSLQTHFLSKRFCINSPNYQSIFKFCE